MNFSQSFIVGEQLKETTEKIYKEGNYYEALQQYNLIYSLFRWLEFKDKTKEETLLKDITKISDMPIIDDDVILKRCAVNEPERRRKAKIINNIKNNGTIDNSISYDSEDEKNENKGEKDDKEDEKDNNIINNENNEDNEEGESSEGEEEEDDEEEENEKSKESLKNDKKEEKGNDNNNIKSKIKLNKNEIKEKQIIKNNKEKEKQNLNQKEKKDNNNIKEKDIKKDNVKK